MADAILFAVVVCLFSISLHGRSYAVSAKDANILRAAMFFTAAADFCMLILYKNELGLCFFLLVQALHHFRLCGAKRTAFQAAFCILAAGAARVLGQSALYCLTAGYAAAWVFSVTGTFLAYRRFPFPNNLMIVSGMVLFLLCDICVGLYNTPALREQSGVFWRMIWVFYLPAQLSISVSAKRHKVTIL